MDTSQSTSIPTHAQVSTPPGHCNNTKSANSHSLTIDDKVQ